MDESAPGRSILLIDNDRERARSIETALQSIERRVITIVDGLQAIEFLFQNGNDREAPHPDLILLELNLPSKDGREILAEIKAHPQLRRIPIVVLTTAASPEDIFNTYELQGNCHVVKSTDLDRLLTIVKRIEEFWLEIVTLPVG